MFVEPVSRREVEERDERGLGGGVGDEMGGAGEEKGGIRVGGEWGHFGQTWIFIICPFQP